MPGQKNGSMKRPQNERRKNARALSHARGVKRHERNREANTLAQRANVNALSELASLRVPNANALTKRPSKVLRAVRRYADPAVQERAQVHEQERAAAVAKAQRNAGVK